MPNGVNRGHASLSFDNGLYRLWTPNSGPDGVHHYERPQLSGDTTKHVRTTETTYVTYPSPGTTQTLSSLIITNRQHEEAENEKKRRIKILRANLVQEFVNEFKLIIKD